MIEILGVLKNFYWSMSMILVMIFASIVVVIMFIDKVITLMLDIILKLELLKEDMKK